MAHSFPAPGLVNGRTDGHLGALLRLVERDPKIGGVQESCDRRAGARRSRQGLGACRDVAGSSGRCLRTRAADLPEDAEQDHRGGHFAAKRDGPVPQALPLGAGNGGIVGALRRAIRYGRRYLEGLPVDVRGRPSRYRRPYRIARRRAPTKAFQSMSVAGTGGFKVVSQGIAAALVATAAGLLVAIYAVIAYNYFVARINGIAMQYKLFSEEFLAALSAMTPNAGARGPTTAAAASTASTT